MNQSMDSATAHIAFYVRDIQRSEDLRRAVLHKRAELLQARRAASALALAGGAGADEDDRMDRKRHNVTINAKGSALAAVCRLMYEKETLELRNPSVAELKAVLTVVQADTRGSRQALVDRCLDEDVAFEIKEQLLAACRGRGGEGGRGRRGRPRGWGEGQRG
jgi:hypothetical protein